MAQKYGITESIVKMKTHQETIILQQHFSEKP